MSEPLEQKVVSLPAFVKTTKNNYINLNKIYSFNSDRCTILYMDKYTRTSEVAIVANCQDFQQYLDKNILNPRNGDL